MNWMPKLCGKYHDKQGSLKHVTVWQIKEYQWFYSIGSGTSKSYDGPDEACIAAENEIRKQGGTPQ